MPRKHDFEDRSLDLIRFYREHPVIAANDLLNVDLPPVQRLILRDMWFKPSVLTSAGRGSGKSFLLSVVSCLYALLYMGKKILITAPSFRQARLVFEEVSQRYTGSPILREATIKKPTVGADTCSLILRGMDNRVGSSILAVPLADGSKIRGLRGHLIVTDEFAQVPEEVFDTVIRPMGATSNNPMERVRRLEKLKSSLKKGLISVDEYDAQIAGEGSNKIICTSSAYYTFNHMYKRIQAYQELIAAGNNNYAVHFVSYKDLPDGFLDMNNIENARVTMSKVQFAIEYEGIWQSDSDGAFKASLIDSCKDESVRVLTRGLPERKYIMGIDPARSADSFAIVIIEIGAPSRVVHAFQAVAKKFPEMAQKIYEYCQNFNVQLIMMDAGAGGGGVAIKDLLANAQFFGSNVIVDMDDKEYKDSKGKHILRMHTPTPSTIAEMVFSSVNLLEQGTIRFPMMLQDFSKEKDEIYADIQEMIRQMLAVTISQTRSGLAHFDIPATGSGSRKKDLYSAFVLAAKGLYDTMIERVEAPSYVNHGGLVIPRGPSMTFHRSSLTPEVSNIFNLPGRR